MEPWFVVEPETKLNEFLMSTDSYVANYQDVTCADPSAGPFDPGDLIKTISLSISVTPSPMTTKRAYHPIKTI